MPSSTSSSELCVPSGRWGSTWLAGIGLALVLLLAIELSWRAAGHRPSIVDGPAWWSHYRKQVSRNGARTIVIAGASRALQDLSPATFRERLPHHHTVQLAVGGRVGTTTLIDLARDESFNGTLILSVTASYLRSRNDDRQASYVRYYHRQGSNLNKTLNQMIAAYLQSKLVAIHPHVNLGKVIVGLATRQGLPAPRYMTIGYDRKYAANYELVDLEEVRKKKREEWARASKSPPPDEWLAQALDKEQYIRRIQERGGHVVLLRVTCGPQANVQREREYPRHEYWDRLAAETSATMVHFADVPGMNNFDCPDLSHLDCRDAPAFTNALIDELLRLGVVEPD